jgi:hypothetical protein
MTTSLPAARRSLDELYQVGLLQEIRPGRYDWHSLVRAYAGRATGAGQTSAARQRVPTQHRERRNRRARQDRGGRWRAEGL